MAIERAEKKIRPRKAIETEYDKMRSVDALAGDESRKPSSKSDTLYFAQWVLGMHDDWAPADALLQQWASDRWGSERLIDRRISGQGSRANDATVFDELKQLRHTEKKLMADRKDQKVLIESLREEGRMIESLREEGLTRIEQLHREIERLGGLPPNTILEGQTRAERAKP